MTRRQEWRLFGTLMIACGAVLCALPLIMPTSRYPAVAFGVGGVMMLAGIWQRRRLRRQHRRHVADTTG